jgi:hypothetical protein
VGKVGITSGLNRKRRILIQHQIKLGTFCIWLAQWTCSWEYYQANWFVSVPLKKLTPDLIVL